MESTVQSEIFDLFRQDQYRFGNCFVRPYDRKDTATFGTTFLHELYDSALASAPSRPFGILEESLCGFSDLSADAVCAYLHTRNPLLLMCTDNPGADTADEFDVIGFVFPAITVGTPWTAPSIDAQRSMLWGYTIFRPSWGTPEAVVCTMLAGIYFFHEYNLLSISGQYLPYNRLTSKFLAQFGTRDTGYIPDFLMIDGKLTDCRLCSLARSDFESYVRRTLVECAQI